MGSRFGGGDPEGNRGLSYSYDVERRGRSYLFVLSPQRIFPLTLLASGLI
jgi:hypothetical protein